MRELLLRRLERDIRAQRQKVVDDRRRIERAVGAVQDKALQAVGSLPGLLMSFSLGAVAAGGPPRSRGVASLVVWDLLTRVVLDELPAIGDLIAELRGGRRERRDDAA
jgi:hypothetical protein